MTQALFLFDSPFNIHKDWPEKSLWCELIFLEFLFWVIAPCVTMTLWALSRSPYFKSCACSGTLFYCSSFWIFSYSIKNEKPGFTCFKENLRSLKKKNYAGNYGSPLKALYRLSFLRMKCFSIRTLYLHSILIKAGKC